MWARNALEQPAPSARTRIGTPCRCASGICASAASRTVMWSAAVFAPALPGRSSPARNSPVLSRTPGSGGSRRWLERRRRLLLLRVADHDRGVHVDDQPGQRRPRPRSPPAPAAPVTSARCAQATSRAAARAAATAASSGSSSWSSSRQHGRVRRHRPEQTRLVGQHGDVGDALRAVGDRDRQIDQHPPRIMHRPRPAQTAPAPPTTRAVSVVRSARSASSRDPACETTPRPSADTTSGGRAVVCTRKVPSRAVDHESLSKPRIPLQDRHFPHLHAGHPTKIMKSRG